MHSSWAAIGAKVVRLNLASGSQVLGFGRAMQMSDHSGRVNQRIWMQRSQSEKTPQSQEVSREARYDEKYYRPVCFRERLYERTWPEYKLEEEYEEPPQPATDPRTVSPMEELELWNEESHRNREEHLQPHHSQSRGDVWAESRKRTR